MPLFWLVSVVPPVALLPQDTVDEFVKEHRPRFSAIEASYNQMVTAFKKCVVRFEAELPKELELEPSSFFGIVEQFLGMARRARRETEILRRKEEQETSRKVAEASAADAAESRRAAEAAPTNGRPELDDLISALKSGDFAGASPSRPATKTRGRTGGRHRPRGGRGGTTHKKT